MTVHKTDNNHSDIINNFRLLGYAVKDMSEVGGGFPDLIVSKHGENILIEIKSETGKLSESQIEFISKWNTAVYLVRNTDDIIELDNNRLPPISVSNFIKFKK